MNYNLNIYANSDNSLFRMDSDRYQKELSEYSDEYLISKESFIEFLNVTNREQNFQTALDQIEKGLESLEWVAMDFTIPVIMVKWFLNKR